MGVVTIKLLENSHESAGCSRWGRRELSDFGLARVMCALKAPLCTSGVPVLQRWDSNPGAIGSAQVRAHAQSAFDDL